MDARAYWVGFNLVKGIGAVRLRGLLDFFGNLETAWDAPGDALMAAGLTPKLIEGLGRVKAENLIERAWNYIERLDIGVLTWDDPAYPSRLKQIDQPPPVLYTRGGFAVQDDLAVAIVGTRRVTSYGRQAAEEIAAFLAHHGITVVSGLARGVDGVAHDAALKAGGRTLAVLGSGVDRIYPPEHLRLAERIEKQGAVISDYPPGTPPESTNFPPRNRIISGLTLATVVIEAGLESGALITATFAAEQGREVFALPGSIYAPQSKGANRLLRDGAQLLLEPGDILEALNLQRAEQHQQARLMLPEDGVEASLVGVLESEPLHVDEICAQSGLPIDQVSATLTIMELKGMVRHMGGMNYSIIREAFADYRSDLDA
ncbi:MAG: DNA-processing protein DprA [Anaerolineaceae bacterium]|nr:DNA-processing protein DprA [Anaerolineaceae bacterium]